MPAHPLRRMQITYTIPIVRWMVIWACVFFRCRKVNGPMAKAAEAVMMCRYSISFQTGCSIVYMTKPCSIRTALPVTGSNTKYLSSADILKISAKAMIIQTVSLFAIFNRSPPVCCYHMAASCSTHYYSTPTPAIPFSQHNHPIVRCSHCLFAICVPHCIQITGCEMQVTIPSKYGILVENKDHSES